MTNLAWMAIPLTRGLYALVDGKDYEWLSRWKWYAQKGRNAFYAIRMIGSRPHRKQIWMHREILSTPVGLETDHKNNYGLDNRRENLRACTTTQNFQNQRKIRNGTSKYKGVCWQKSGKRKKRWQAYIRVNKKLIHLGYFQNEIKAAKAYDAKAKELFGEYAHTNL